MGALLFWIRMGDLRPRFAQSEAQAAEEALALTDTQGNRELPMHESRQRFPVPKIGRDPHLLRRPAQNAPDQIQLLSRQTGRATRAHLLLQAGQPVAVEGSNPTFTGARSIAQDQSSLSATHALGHKKDRMQAVLVTRFIGTADLVLQGQYRQSRIGNQCCAN